MQEVLKHMFAEAGSFAPADQMSQPRQRLADFIDSYLSEAHRNSPAQGCPVAALVSEIAHLPEQTRSIFAQGVDALHGGLAQMLRDVDLTDADALASSIQAEMVGALARACLNIEGASQILQRSRDALKQLAGLVTA